jgi:CPA1 family monovalent cation:H+ antiporter
MVVAGVIVGSAETRPDARHRGVFGRLDTFWTLVDEVLNAILFVLIGLEVLTLSRRADILPPLGAVAVGAALAVPVVLLGRAVSVALPVALLRVRYRFARGAVGILIWGGLRGGLPVAMALSIPAAASTAAARGVVLAMTYAVVVFSLLVQGLTIERLVRRSTRAGRATPE